jgi:phosphoenolpyruvate synthase/pyruvate phosphate dikinase
MKLFPLKDIKKENWELYLARNIDFLTLVANARSNSDDLKKRLGFGIESALYLTENKMANYYRDNDEQTKFILKIYKIIKNSPEKLIKILKNAEKINKLMKYEIEEAKMQKEYFQKNSLKNLGDIFRKKYNLLYFHFAPCVVIPYFVGVASEKYGVKSKNKKVENILAKSKKLRAISYYINYRELIVGSILKEIAFRKNISVKIINKLTPEEIIELCNSNKRIIKKDKRTHAVYFRKYQEEYFQFDKVFYKSLRKILTKDKTKQKLSIIYGKIGYKGVKEGVAKVVYNKKDFSKFRKGDILVTINANPSLSPIIKKSKAIIADDGGITSHAAIVSREQKIPCIIGTKIATKVLKDGDLVEVDADKGIVRIIKKAK